MATPAKAPGLAPGDSLSGPCPCLISFQTPNTKQSLEGQVGRLAWDTQSSPEALNLDLWWWHHYRHYRSSHKTHSGPENKHASHSFTLRLKARPYAASMLQIHTFKQPIIPLAYAQINYMALSHVKSAYVLNVNIRMPLQFWGPDADIPGLQQGTWRVRGGGGHGVRSTMKRPDSQNRNAPFPSQRLATPSQTQILPSKWPHWLEFLGFLPQLPPMWLTFRNSLLYVNENNHEAQTSFPFWQTFLFWVRCYFGF